MGQLHRPQAKAFHLLKKLDLGPLESTLRQAGEIIFEEFGGAPGNSYTWVEPEGRPDCLIAASSPYRAEPAGSAASLGILLDPALGSGRGRDAMRRCRGLDAAPFEQSSPAPPLSVALFTSP
jgi:hypothetical protein